MYALIRYISENPRAGVAMVGKDGTRKLRWVGKTKSGGYRVITFFSSEEFSVVLYRAPAVVKRALAAAD